METVLQNTARKRLLAVVDADVAAARACAVWWCAYAAVAAAPIAAAWADLFRADIATVDADRRAGLLAVVDEVLRTCYVHRAGADDILRSILLGLRAQLPSSVDAAIEVERVAGLAAASGAVVEGNEAAAAAGLAAPSVDVVAATPSGSLALNRAAALRSVATSLNKWRLAYPGLFAPQWSTAAAASASAARAAVFSAMGMPLSTVDGGTLATSGTGSADAAAAPSTATGVPSTAAPSAVGDKSSAAAAGVTTDGAATAAAAAVAAAAAAGGTGAAVVSTTGLLGPVARAAAKYEAALGRLRRFQADPNVAVSAVEEAREEAARRLRPLLTALTGRDYSAPVFRPATTGASDDAAALVPALEAELAKLTAPSAAAADAGDVGAGLDEEDDPLAGHFD
jgi:hypothetical protein